MYGNVLCIINVIISVSATFSEPNSVNDYQATGELDRRKVDYIKTLVHSRVPKKINDIDQLINSCCDFSLVFFCCFFFIIHQW